MRILHLGKYYPPALGGIESHVQTLARGQSAAGCQVSVLCVNHADSLGKDITHARLKSTSSVSEADGAIRVERVGRWFGLNRLEVCPSLPGRIREEIDIVDIVHLHTPNPLMLGAWWLAGSRNKPLVITHHSDVIKQRVLKWAVAPVESRVYGRAKLILSDSPTYGDGSAILQKFAAKTRVLPLGIDLDPYLVPSEEVANTTKRLRKELGEALWLMVGRMTYYKGYHIALEAMTKVPGKLVIVGNGPLESELKDKANLLGVNQRIVWKKQVNPHELTALYYAATALWFPSMARSEGFGLVQVEAMACGCPVINTAIPASGVSWVSLDQVSGITVPMGDANALAHAALQLIQNPELREILATGAKERAKTEFDANEMVKRSLDYYKGTC